MRRILVSACLFGICCRYDGKEKENQTIMALLEREDVCLIPVCPEQLGGLETPRPASERRGESVVNRAGEDMTGHFAKGAKEVLKIAKMYHCDMAILKERSPSCGKGQIYDGTFTGKLIQGNGVTAELLERHGILVLGESQLAEGRMV